MLLRRILPVALAAAALVACEPAINESKLDQPGPSSVDYVVFDPATSQIPLPNDLGLIPSAIATQQGAQKELLTLFAGSGGYPNDQEMPITIDVQTWKLDSTTAPVKAPLASPLDVASLNPGTLLVLEKKAGATTPVPVPPSSLETTYTVATKDACGAAATPDRGTITIRNKPNASGSRRWNAGSTYYVILRAGPNGVKEQNGATLNAMPTMYFLTQGADLSKPENQLLLPGNGRQEKAAVGAQLEALRQGYLPLFNLADQVWGAGASKTIGSVQSFTIAPYAGAQVMTDTSSGAVPLPSDLLLDPCTGGKTVVNNPAFGPAAAGLATLDGFSTSAMVLSQTDKPVVAATVNKDTVFIYDLSNPAAPVRVKEVSEVTPTTKVGFVAEPYPLTRKADGTTPCAATDNPQGCFSTAIGLQPATPWQVGGNFVPVPPLKEKTEYAVIVTSSVLAAPSSGSTTPAPIRRSTLSSMLLFENPLYDAATGKSNLTGQTPQQMAGLEAMRKGVAAAAAALQAEKGITKDKIVLGYTFRTQTITAPALQLAAAPYTQQALFVPGTPVAATAPIPLTAADFFVTPVPTLNPIDPTTGALNPDTSKWTPMQLNAFVFLPKSTANIPACPAPAGALKCAPLVVFQHGLGGSKNQVFPVADAMATAGFVTVAIDAPLHGDRAWCTSDAECTCAAYSPAGCTPKCNLNATIQPADTAKAGMCGNGSVAVPAVSARFIFTQNFFRTRDALRESVLDNSAAILAFAPLTTPANAFAQLLQARGLAVDSRKVYVLGFSAGAVMTTMTETANPRVSRAVVMAPTGNIMNTMTTGSYASVVIPLLGTPGTEAYLKTLNVAKWILDPADPGNFAQYTTSATLPNLLADPTGATKQSAKNVFAQFPYCDQTVPNPDEFLYVGIAGLPQTPVASGQNGFTPYVVSGAGLPGSCSTDPAKNPHSFLLDPTLDAAATVAGQTDAATYLLNLTLPAKATRP